jgi:glyceraldehyde-3-phosphate dehydrogenase/erythrose-4-phosphate dehydrogenase
MTRVAVNGIGRIGRDFFGAYREREPGFAGVAGNDLGNPNTCRFVHLVEWAL